MKKVTIKRVISANNHQPWSIPRLFLSQNTKLRLDLHIETYREKSAINTITAPEREPETFGN